MFNTIIDLVNFFIGVHKFDEEIEQREKTRISDMLQNISDILKDTHNKLTTDTYPHDNCRVLEILCGELKNVIDPYLSDEQKTLLINSINESVNIEKLYHERQNNEVLEQLLYSSGEFRALSLLIKVQN